MNYDHPKNFENLSKGQELVLPLLFDKVYRTCHELQPVKNYMKFTGYRQNLNRVKWGAYSRWSSSLLLPHAGFGQNNNQEDALHFKLQAEESIVFGRNVNITNFIPKN